MKPWLKGLALAAAFGALLAGQSSAQTVAPVQVPAQVPAKIKAAPQTPIPAQALPPDPTLALPDTDTAKRVGGYTEEALGGADCRTGCDKTYYMCLSNDDGGACQSRWATCLAACPSRSTNF